MGPNLRVGGSGARDGIGYRKPSPTRSIVLAVSSTNGRSAAKRPGNAPASDVSQGAPPLGDDSHLAVLGKGITSVMQSCSASFAALANNAAIEEEYPAPLLIETNAVWRKLCAAVEELGASLVAIPADQMISNPHNLRLILRQRGA